MFVVLVLGSRTAVGGGHAVRINIWCWSWGRLQLAVAARLRTFGVRDPGIVGNGGLLVLLDGIGSFGLHRSEKLEPASGGVVLHRSAILSI